MTKSKLLLAGLLALILFGELAMVLYSHALHTTAAQTIDAKQVGIALYGPYLLAVELASMLLLAALVTAYHLGREREED